MEEFLNIFDVGIFAYPENENRAKQVSPAGFTSAPKRGKPRCSLGLS